MEPPEYLEHFTIERTPTGILQELGRGAMGVTYLGRDTRLDRRVAIKVINPAITRHPDVVQRFLREAQAAANLIHPNVAAVYHFGEVAGFAFYVMEFCDGPTVQRLVLDHGPLTPEITFALGLQIARALCTAEELHLIHRDLKPSNLIVTKRLDGPLAVKMIDFGLAYHYSAHGEDLHGTPPEAFTGTVWFASPEQIQEKPLDIRSDFYALGACIWFMLTGKPVFTGSVAEVLTSTLNADPPFSELPELPSSAQDLLKSLLEKERGSRPTSALALCHQLESALASIEAAKPAPPSAPKEAASTAEAPAPKIDHHDSTDIFDRVRIEGELERHPCWNACHGRWSATGEPVSIHILTPAVSAVPSLLRGLEENLRALQAHPHPNASRILAYGRSSKGWAIVSQPVVRTTALHLLKARGSLRPSEVIRLLTAIAAALDHLEDRVPASQSADLTSIVISFAPEVDHAELLRQPVQDWPPFQVAVNALGLQRLTAAPGMETISAMNTIAPTSESRAPATTTAAQLANVFYQLVGGTFSTRGTFTPLPRLTEEANQLLREAQLGRMPTASAWITRLDAVLDIEIPPPAEPPQPPPHAGLKRRELLYVLLILPVCLGVGWLATSLWKNRHADDPRAVDRSISILEDIMRRRQAMSATLSELDSIQVPRLLEAKRNASSQPNAGWEEIVDTLSRAIRKRESTLAEDQARIAQFQSSLIDSWRTYPHSYEEALQAICDAPPQEQNPEMTALANEFLTRMNALRKNPASHEGEAEFLRKIAPAARWQK